jgi:hypothetical protein
MPGDIRGAPPHVVLETDIQSSDRPTLDGAVDADECQGYE